MDAEGTAQSACRKILNKTFGERKYSAQETAHLLFGIPLVRSSVTFQSTYIGEERYRKLGTNDNIDEGELAVTNNQDDQMVTTESWFQRYMERPAGNGGIVHVRGPDEIFMD